MCSQPVKMFLLRATKRSGLILITPLSPEVLPTQSNNARLSLSYIEYLCSHALFASTSAEDSKLVRMLNKKYIGWLCTFYAYNPPSYFRYDGRPWFRLLYLLFMLCIAVGNFEEHKTLSWSLKCIWD